MITYNLKELEFYEQCAKKDSQHLIDLLNKSPTIEHAYGHGLRINFIISALKQLNENSLLDIGFGGCFFEMALKNHFKETTGIDLTTSFCSYGKKYLDNTLRTDWVSLPFKDKAFDVCIWSEGPEHAVNCTDVFHEIKRVTKKCLITSVPDWSYLIPGHLRTFTQESFQKELEKVFDKISVIYVKPEWLVALCIIGENK